MTLIKDFFNSNIFEPNFFETNSYSFQKNWNRYGQYFLKLYICDWFDKASTFLAPMSVYVWSRFSWKCRPHHLFRSCCTYPVMACHWSFILSWQLIFTENSRTNSSLFSGSTSKWPFQLPPCPISKFSFKKSEVLSVLSFPRHKVNHIQWHFWSNLKSLQDLLSPDAE